MKKIEKLSKRKVKKCTARDGTSSSSTTALRDGGTPHSYPQLRGLPVRSTQRKLLRLIVQTKRKYKKKTQTSKNGKDEEGEKEDHGSSDEEIVECSGSNTDCDQDSDVSFMKDTDEEIDAGEIEEDEWTDYMKRSTAIAAERLKAAKMP